MNAHDKEKVLIENVRYMGKAAVAFSGGVDSSYLVKICYDEMKESAAAITLVSPLNPRREIEEAKEIARRIGIRHVLIENDTIDPVVAGNSIDRCYYCKKIVFDTICKAASELGISVVLDGSNLDDLSDYRPGMKALAELSIMSPLRDAGMTKQDIRERSRVLGLDTWNKPAFACLATRVPYGEKITKETLLKIEKAEDYLRSLGFIQFRIRSHGAIARIEVSPDERRKFYDDQIMTDVSLNLKSMGYAFVALELEGYSTGSMNKIIAS